MAGRQMLSSVSGVSARIQYSAGMPSATGLWVILEKEVGNKIIIPKGKKSKTRKALTRYIFVKHTSQYSDRDSSAKSHQADAGWDKLGINYVSLIIRGASQVAESKDAYEPKLP